MSVHPLAIISGDVEMEENVSIGPFCVITCEIHIGANTRIEERVSIKGRVIIGEKNHFHPGALIGSTPQDRAFTGGDSRVRIGHGNVIREYATIHSAVPAGEDEPGETVVGDGNMLLAYSHVSHNSRLGDGVVLSNLAHLGGYTVVEDGAVLGAYAGTHQFSKVGTLAMVGAKSKVTQDVPPFMMVDGSPARVVGLNSVGLDRAGMTREEKAELKRAYRILCRSKRSIGAARARLQEEPPPNENIRRILAFIEGSERGVCRGKK